MEMVGCPKCGLTHVKGGMVAGDGLSSAYWAPVTQERGGEIMETIMLLMSK